MKSNYRAFSRWHLPFIAGVVVFIVNFLITKDIERALPVAIGCFVGFFIIYLGTRYYEKRNANK
ncbi:hypothetical protein JOC34_003400 [Virgibacillus halotolerans]|uniref:hypothetical protein n=1 Tax=Virgibacillus halotolerans TaxID=1071053 RepID=UPI001961AFFB|nr:hypothetical protein [Virgibacillus halotolerans]MBM7600979.1 hypothetical protein [Virgibacillus halotolerans]